ncbi:MAG: HD domain-containing protein [Candidatus Omnitrophica bacterium]|nr:HD domain-containing protein [Candidatus Omnitrophota bacterium]
MNLIPPLSPPCDNFTEEIFWVHDPLLRNLGLTISEYNLVVSDILSRLSYIKQNSFVYFVYPVASHTRLQHSLGVMHLVDFAFSSIWLKKNEIEMDEKSFNNTRKFIRLAALLHDIGHGPLSHISEMFLELLCNDEEEEMILDKLKDSCRPGRSKLKPHECKSKEIIRNEGKQLIENALESAGFDKRDINPLIEILSDFSVGDLKREVIEDNEKILKKYFGQYKDIYWVNDLISSDFDMDRLEYYLRDPYFAGVGETIIDYKRILISLLQSVDIIEPPKANIRKKIAVEEDRGIGMLESLLVTRSLMYPYVYEHTTARSANALLLRAIHQIKLEKGIKTKNGWKEGWMEWEKPYPNPNKNDLFLWIKPHKSVGHEFNFPEFYKDTDIQFVFKLANFLKELGLIEFSDSIRDLVYRKLYKKCRYTDKQYPGKKRPQYIRYKNIHPDVINCIKKLTESEKQFNEKFFNWVRHLEYELEFYTSNGKIDNFKEWSKRPPSFIIDIPELPSKQKKEQGIDLLVLESGKERSYKKFAEMTKINEATDTIRERDWLIAIYSNKSKNELEKIEEKMDIFIKDYFSLGGFGSAANLFS